jgi:alpha-galactosidase
MLDLRRKSTGEDLYPLLKERLSRPDAAAMPLTRKLLEVYGYYPTCLDSHFGEYIPYAYEYFTLKPSNFANWLEQENKRWQYLKDLAENKAQWDRYQDYLGSQKEFSAELRLDDFFRPRSWADTLAFPVIAALTANRLHRMPALNLLNQGIIPNLPDDIFVEVPAVVEASGIWPFHIGDLPKPLAAFNRRDIDQMELTVEAAVHGDRRLAMQSMLLDPVVDSVRAAEAALDELLKVNAPYLPQFK